MLDQTKNFLIGLFILAAVGIVTYIMLFLHPSMGDEGQVVNVRFADIDKVSVGTRVLFGGHPVGEVTRIRIVPDARTQKPFINRDIYIYELTLRIDSSVSIYTSDKISARTSGLLGEKSISIDPEPPKPGQPLVKVTDEILYASSPVSIEDAVKKFEDLGATIKETFNKINEGLDKMEKENLWDHIATTAKNISEITTAFNQPEDIEVTVKELREFAENLNTLQDKISTSWDTVDEVFANLHDITDTGKEIFDDMQEGKGTLGRLLVNDDFYLRMTSVMSKAQTLMDDINHYGLLFHNNPNWKRIRARRMNLLHTLCTPQEFHNYFNDEVNQITTSLSRVAMVLRDCDTINYWDAVCCPEFECVFADLLRRVEGLDQELKMVNEQAADRREGICECCWE